MHHYRENTVLTTQEKRKCIFSQNKKRMCGYPSLEMSQSNGRKAYVRTYGFPRCTACFESTRRKAYVCTYAFFSLQHIDLLSLTVTLTVASQVQMQCLVYIGLANERRLYVYVTSAHSALPLMNYAKCMKSSAQTIPTTQQLNSALVC